MDFNYYNTDLREDLKSKFNLNNQDNHLQSLFLDRTITLAFILQLTKTQCRNLAEIVKTEHFKTVQDESIFTYLPFYLIILRDKNIDLKNTFEVRKNFQTLLQDVQQNLNNEHRDNLLSMLEFFVDLYRPTTRSQKLKEDEYHLDMFHKANPHITGIETLLEVRKFLHKNLNEVLNHINK